VTPNASDFQNGGSGATGGGFDPPVSSIRELTTVAIGDVSVIRRAHLSFSRVEHQAATALAAQSCRQ
jgi:hypothetical protein